MNHEELLKKVETVIHHLNDDGLNFMYYLVGDMHEIEKFNINTTPERVAKIKKQEADKAELEEIEEKKKQKRDSMVRMEKQIGARQEMIVALTGKERIFWNKIEKVQKMSAISRYCMKTWQVLLIAKLYDNKYLDASYSCFCYGFHQGMQYMKNRARKFNSSSIAERGCIE